MNVYVQTPVLETEAIGSACAMDCVGERFNISTFQGNECVAQCREDRKVRPLLLHL